MHSVIKCNLSTFRNQFLNLNIYYSNLQISNCLSSNSKKHFEWNRKNNPSSLRTLEGTIFKWLKSRKLIRRKTRWEYALMATSEELTYKENPKSKERIFFLCEDCLWGVTSLDKSHIEETIRKRKHVSDMLSRPALLPINDEWFLYCEKTGIEIKFGILKRPNVKLDCQ